MQEVYIVAAVRTPIGRFGGGLMGLSPADLGATVMKSALEIANLPPEDLDLYISYKNLFLVYSLVNSLILV